MSLPARDLRLKAPVAPTEAEWAALSPAQQDRLEEELRRALCAALEAEPPEGDAHQEAWIEAKETLQTYYRRRGIKGIYIGADKAVFYPGRPAFAPDLIAVRDVEPHPRNTWNVVREGKGIDLALEFRSEGDRDKDFVVNVREYAALGIQEYFAFDLKRQLLKGWHLPGPDARTYQPILPQGGRFSSAVLELDLMVREGTIRFFAGTAELLGGRRLVVDLERMLDEAQGRFEEAQDAAAQAQDAAAQAQEVTAEACAALAGMVLGVLQLRGLPIDDEQRSRIQGCRDLEQLKRWAAQATSVPRAEDLFLGSRRAS